MPDKMLIIDDAPCIRQEIVCGEEPDCQSMLTGLGKKYREKLPERLKMLEQLIPKAVAGSRDALDEIILEAHKLRGTAPTFGLSILGDAIADVEDLLVTASMEHLTFHDSAAWMCVDRALCVAKSAVLHGPHSGTGIVSAPSIVKGKRCSNE